MRKTTLMLGAGLMLASLGLFAQPAAAEEVTYEITIHNMTHGQPFSPFVIFSHNSRYQLFRLGKPAAQSLYMIAEEGDNSLLVSKLKKSNRVGDVVAADGPMLPGEIRSFMLTVDDKNPFIGLAAMLGRTNDGFVGAFMVNPSTTTTLWLNGYDAGTEVNSESAATTAALGAAGVRDTVGAEGYVHIHRGIQGIGDLDKDLTDWRNPCALVTIKPVK